MKITIIGFGSWGIALACLLAENGHAVTGWDNPAYIEKLRKNGRVNEYLPKVVIPESVRLTDDVSEAATGAEMFVVALSSKAIATTAPSFSEHFTAEKTVVIVSKGLEETRQIRLSQYLSEVSAGCKIVALTGPSHAEEVAQGIPTTIVAASECEEAAKTVQTVFSSESFRVYTSPDLLGAEMGGALKNVIALAAGISDGLGFGDNTKAALITRGIAEITRLGIAMGANAQTFAGLSGTGDLIVTCTSQHSRNWRAGNLLAKGNSLDATLAEIGAAVEGVNTAKTALSFAKKHDVDMPIVEEINRVLFEGKSPKAAVADLMRREKKEE